MFTISAQQMDTLTRNCFWGRLERFIKDDSLRSNGFKEWAANRARLHEIWAPVWPWVKQQSEHDCALYLVFVAVRAFEGHASSRPEAQVAHIADNIVRLKLYLSDKGYFRFTAFDRGVIEDAAAHV